MNDPDPKEMAAELASDVETLLCNIDKDAIISQLAVSIVSTESEKFYTIPGHLLILMGTLSLNAIVQKREQERENDQLV